MVTFTEHRAKRMWAAHAYVGWDRPPYPHEGDGRNIGRVVLAGRYAGFHPNNSALKSDLDLTIKTKERAQARKHFN